MKKVAFEVLVVILKIIYLPIKLCSTRKKIVFITRQSNKIGIDMQMIIECINVNYPEIEVVALAKTVGDGVKGIITYSLHMLRQMYHIATSKVVVVDGYCIAVSVLNHKKSLKVVQIWHALGAVKKFGYDSIDKPSGTDGNVASAMKMHRNYDYVLASSQATAEHFSSGFNTDISKMKFLGLPRIDFIKSIDEEKNQKIKKNYNIEEHKEIILYVPTFRKGKSLPLQELISSFDIPDSVLIVKLHPLDNTRIPEKINNNVIFDKSFTSYEWARISSKIITDYSALAIEGTLLDVPMFFYVYDYDKYQEDPGLNINLKDEMGIYVQDNAEDLFKVMKEDYDYSLLRAFKNKYIAVDEENCTLKVTDFIMSLLEANNE